ncbi:MAG: radical SAM protein [Candidatus Aenigmarchaeota archaeon]|nr:radical SAM protein [Candidatus Aenigmarchaeota archaeon]
MEKRVVIERRGLYVEPISACNLKCRMCYSNVINGKGRKEISKDALVDFVGRFGRERRLGFGVFWCGTGEIFLHAKFPEVINSLSAWFMKGVVGRGVKHFIVTNGTIDRLDEFERLNNVTFHVSIDGPKDHHEWNRGKGTYEKAVGFCRRAYELGCEGVKVRTIVTKGNANRLADFEDELKRDVDRRIRLNLTFPYSNREMKGAMTLSKTISRRTIDDSLMLPSEEMKRIVAAKYGKRFRDEKKLVPFGPGDIKTYISLNPYGVFSCCEGIVKIGDPRTSMKELLTRMETAKDKCLACPLSTLC